jgi:hypothetical protein
MTAHKSKPQPQDCGYEIPTAESEARAIRTAPAREKAVRDMLNRADAIADQILVDGLWPADYLTETRILDLAGVKTDDLDEEHQPGGVARLIETAYALGIAVGRRLGPLAFKGGR